MISKANEYTKELKKHLFLKEYKVGSKDKLINLIKKYPQKSNNKINYLIAGSWAIEFASNKKLKHTDIDIISLQDPVFYVDDAKMISEKCYGKIPLSLEYFIKNYLIVKYMDQEIYLPTLNLQLSLKFIGELKPVISKRAIKQIKLLLGVYEKNIVTDLNELHYILKILLPKELDIDLLTKKIIKLINNYKQKKNIDLEIIKIHKIINSKLLEAFKKIK